MIHISEYETIKITNSDNSNTLIIEYVDTSANYEASKFILKLNKTMSVKLLFEINKIIEEMEERVW